MTATIIDGNKIAQAIFDGAKSKIADMKQKPGLALVLVGNNPASESYVNFKEKNCKEIGMYCERFNLKESARESELLELIGKLNQNQKLHGILVQLPLPKHIDESLIVDAILPRKDVDGLTPLNLGYLAANKTIIAPATARGVIHLIESTGIKIKGKNAVVIGRSNMVGKPTALLLLEKNATVSVCHSKTKNLSHYTKNADILVSAVGSPRLVNKDMIKPGAVVIDVGTTKEGNKLVGDVDFDNVKEAAGFITPVPGGVGPMTRAMLMDNTLKAFELTKVD
jgi:methylenetetrahydrofolate dehydrogenase (NADP+) / methenyltetrahydrofolate cyclohydrolase